MSLEELKEKRRCREILLKCGISKEDIERGLKRGDYKEIYYEDDVLAWVENARKEIQKKICNQIVFGKKYEIIKCVNADDKKFKKKLHPDIPVSIYREKKYKIGICENCQKLNGVFGSDAKQDEISRGCKQFPKVSSVASSDTKKEKRQVGGRR